jgi:hypothetical protein
VIVELHDSITAEVVYGAGLRGSPRLGLRDLSLIVGPYDSGDAHEQHFLQTIGSGNWYRPEFDEFRFAKEDLLLQSIWFHVPEKNLSSEEFFVGWRAEQPVVGLLRLASSEEFELEPTDFRWMEPNGELLACVTQMALGATEAPQRLRIAHDLDLLFANRRLCGWLLSHPARYLVTSWEDPCAGEADSGLAALLHEYSALVAEPYIDQMENEDPDILKELLSLHARLRRENETRNPQRVLRECVEDIIEQFYGRTMRGE